MRRLTLVLAATAILVPALAGAAAAKGEMHVKVTIGGPGLPGGIVTLGGDGTEFLATSGLWQAKWDGPNIGGTIEPDAELGPAYDVRVVFGCGGGPPTRFTETLYPHAPGGPQLLTPAGLTACGSEIRDGFYSVGPVAAQILRRHGVDLTPLDTTVVDNKPTAARDGGVPMLAAVGVFALAALVGVELIRRRRRLRPS